MKSNQRMTGVPQQVGGGLSVVGRQMGRKEVGGLLKVCCIFLLQFLLNADQDKIRSCIMGRKLCL